ncbi:alpha/beta hydrolase family protein [Geojedonia litorea]|uniref:Alpha/beta hydrolase family protein n=1 Tax=Geojedonia litorea TaxID=1268269 RepID=A0ABV9N659_9FLAO
MFFNLSYYSNEKQIDSLVSPTFLVHAIDDKSVPVENSITYFHELRNKNVKAEIHLYQKGGHGFGLGENESSPMWAQQCTQWLKLNHFID